MAHFAELDEQGIVTNVISVSNDVLEHKDFPESEVLGVTFCAQLFGGGIWKQTSRTGSFRHRFAAIGGYYDATLDAFIDPRPYPSWYLDHDVADWRAPIDRPEDGVYRWDEAEMQWMRVVQEGEPDYEVE